MTEYLLKKPSDSDYEFLKTVHHTTLKEHISKIWGWDEGLQDSFFKEEYETGLIQMIEVSNQNIGYLILNKNPDSLYVVELLILPQHQGRGLGTQILKDLIQQAASNKMTLKMGVFKVNTRAKELYSSLGFKVFDETETHFVMRFDSHPVQIQLISGTEATAIDAFYEQEGKRHRARSSDLFFVASIADTIVGVCRF